MEIQQFVDNLCIYDPEFEAFADTFKSESDAAGGNTTTCAVSCMDDLKAAFSKYVNVKFVEFCLHGTPGMFHFASGTAMVGSYVNTLCTNPNFLAKDARVLFDNCSIGNGEQGDKFMDSIGSGLLMGKGGTVGATTVTNIGFMYITNVFMNPLADGRLKVKRYDASGKLVGSRSVDKYGVNR